MRLFSKSFFIGALAALTCAETAHSQPKASPSAYVTLNYHAVDIRDAAKSILGDSLGLKYSVDPAAQGTITVEAAKPVPRTDVLPLLESDLVAAKLSLVRRGDVYTIVPLEDSSRSPVLVKSQTQGFGAESVRLRYVGAGYMKKMIAPFAQKETILAGQDNGPLLVISGPADQRKSLVSLVHQLDISALRNKTAVLLTPSHADAPALVAQLDKAFNSPGLPTAGMVKFAAVKSLNAILAISARADYLAMIKSWMDLLDRQGDDNGRQLFVYHVQNGRASDLAAVIIPAFTVPRKMFEPPALREGGNGQQGKVDERFRTMPQRPGGLPPTMNRFLNTHAQQQATATTQTNKPPSSPTQGATVLWVPGGVSPITIAADAPNNSVVVYATPAQFSFVADALRKLDLPPLRVLIEATLAEVTLDDALRYGVQWYFNKYSDSQVSLSNGSTATPVQQFPGFSYLLSSGNTVTAVLNALSAITEVRVVSTPKMNVLNNHTAALQVGEQVPITTGSLSSTLTSTPSIVNQVQYKNTGVILKATPRVNEDGIVLLDLAQEVSDVEPTTTSNINSPSFSARKFASSFALKDGNTLTLSGLIRNNTTQIKTGIPYLNQIPWLGVLFGSTSKETKKTELLVFITAHVEHNTQDSSAVTKELIEKIRAMAPPPPPIMLNAS